jgi:hypothetical protein
MKILFRASWDRSPTSNWSLSCNGAPLKVLIWFQSKSPVKSGCDLGNRQSALSKTITKASIWEIYRKKFYKYILSIAVDCWSVNNKNCVLES